MSQLRQSLATKDEVNPATVGDNFYINLYERPFQLDNTYRPDADIAVTYISDNGGWYYFSTELIGPNPATKTMDSPIGYEIDFDRDGRGDFLLWATPPYSTSWTNTDVQIYAGYSTGMLATTGPCCQTLPPPSRAMVTRRW